MSSEIEDFLRRAVQQRHRRAQRPPPDVEILDPVAVDAEIVEAEAVPRQDLASHVKGYFHSDVAERISHLGEDVGLADDKMEAHLKQAFDHRLGQLQDTSGGEEKPKAAVKGKTIAELLRTPESIRNAVILSEVLNRKHF